MTLRQSGHQPAAPAACLRESWAGQVLSLETAGVTGAERSYMEWGQAGLVPMGGHRQDEDEDAEKAPWGKKREPRESGTEVGPCPLRTPSAPREAWGPLLPPCVPVLHVTALAAQLPRLPRLPQAHSCLRQPKSLNYGKRFKKQSKEENSVIENGTKDMEAPQRSTTSQLTCENALLLAGGPGNSNLAKTGKLPITGGECHPLCWKCR